MNTSTMIDRALLAAILVVLAVSVVIHLRDPVYFAAVYAFEDGLVESATALFLFVASLVLLGAAARLWRKARHGAAALSALYGAIFLAGAGEEISWGQRIFGWQASEFFQQHNKQLETNLHNLVIGEFDLAKTLFGGFLTAVILAYLVALPLLYPRLAGLRRVVDRLAIPVPGLRHTIFAIAASLAIAAMDQNRKWEVYELVFSLLMVSVFVLPQNREAIR